MPINRYLLMKEKAFTNQIVRAFNDLKKDIQTLLKKQDTQKTFNEDIKILLNAFNIFLAKIIQTRAKETVIKGAQELAKQFESNFKIDFNSPNEPAQRYLESLILLHSSHTRDGSIGKTTYVRVLELIRDGQKNKLSYTEIADKITELDPLVFSKSRAENIAITELGNAYEYGKYRTAQDIMETEEGEMMKRWSTARDERVRPSHRKNSEDGWIKMNERFSGTGSLTATEGSRCRCATVYKLI